MFRIRNPWLGQERHWKPRNNGWFTNTGTELPIAMGSPAKKSSNSASERKKRIARGVAIVNHGVTALTRLADALDDDFALAVDKLVHMRGCLIVCGIGKAGLIGRKLAATFASTGTPSHFLHPSEALHGDLGCVGPNDIVLVLSNSGSTEEIVQLLPYLSRRAATLISITSGANSPLARASDLALVLPPFQEACQHNLAPTTSTVAMLAIGDALAMVVSEAKGFRVEDFAELHPGGALGRKLSTVDEAMRPVTDCRVSLDQVTIRQMLVEVSKPGRRSGAVMIVDGQGVLVGIFTDSDLAKMLEHHREAELDRLIGEVMTTQFSAVRSGARLQDAIEIMAKRKISELPVVDGSDLPLGLIDITDILGIDTTSSAPIARAVPPHSMSSQQDSSSELSPSSEDEWNDGPTTLRIFGPLK
jgi:arabinose-5-phosphate isomerase